MLSHGPTERNTLHVLQAMPRLSAEPAPIDVDDRLVATLCAAIRTAVADGSPAVDCTVLTLEAGPLAQVDLAALAAPMAAADIVHVHHCLSAPGLFLASQARLRGCRVIGSDIGRSEVMPLARWHKRMLAVFDHIQTSSALDGVAFAGSTVPVRHIGGPVDDVACRPGPQDAHDPGLIVAVGPIRPDRGWEALIDGLPPGARLVLAGPVDDPAYARSLEQRSGTRPVRFADERDGAGLLALVATAGLYVEAAPDGPVEPERSSPTALESLAAGVPAIVSRTGACAELAGLPGCWAAANAAERSALLDRWGAGALERPSAEQIRTAVVARFGLLAFGRAYVDLIRSL